MNKKQLSIYDHAKHWVAQYESIDEVKDFADKSAAVAEYARRSKDTELEEKAQKARLRAKRRMGELLSKLDLDKGGRPPKTDDQLNMGFSKGPTLETIGLTGHESSEAQKMANVSVQDFEDILAGKIKEAPTASEARKKATETGKAQISRTGKIHFPGSTAKSEREHDEREADKQERYFLVIEALEKINEIRDTPDQCIRFLYKEADYMAPRLNRNLKSAMPWLEKFNQLWRQKNA